MRSSWPSRPTTPPTPSSAPSLPLSSFLRLSRRSIRQPRPGRAPSASPARRPSAAAVPNWPDSCWGGVRGVVSSPCCRRRGQAQRDCCSARFPVPHRPQCRRGQAQRPPDAPPRRGQAQPGDHGAGRGGPLGTARCPPAGRGGGRPRRVVAVLWRGGGRPGAVPGPGGSWRSPAKVSCWSLRLPARRATCTTDVHSCPLPDADPTSPGRACSFCPRGGAGSPGRRPGCPLGGQLIGRGPAMGARHAPAQVPDLGGTRSRARGVPDHRLGPDARVVALGRYDACRGRRRTSSSPVVREWGRQPADPWPIWLSLAGAAGPGRG